MLKSCDIVVDVGGEYDHEKQRYDHHQKGFGVHFPEHQTKLSSAGLVYLHYGQDIIQELNKQTLDESILSLIYNKVYTGFIEHIDGIDNGVEVSDGPLNYKISTNLSSRVAYLNPQWNEENNDTITNERFKQAMELTSVEFIDQVLHWTRSWLPARAIVEATFDQREAIDASGQVLKFDKYCPWKSHVYDIEQERQMEGLIKFVLYEDGNKTMWRIQAVNVQEGKFELRLGLPEAWRGLRDEELSQVAAIPDCTFCHAGGFIGGNKTLAGALAMAQAALAAANSKRPRTE